MRSGMRKWSCYDRLASPHSHLRPDCGLGSYYKKLIQALNLARLSGRVHLAPKLSAWAGTQHLKHSRSCRVADRTLDSHQTHWCKIRTATDEGNWKSARSCTSGINAGRLGDSFGEGRAL